ncbi:GntR family transcriptional regulator [Aestuariicoccus sp. MJ-SS9]|uniref:GntR family transcriptional regulator n=1 Tax=Aestuariicoccus sp. MJ-SS9 TaxID=3079855 RepID=UPI002906D71F|nr:GntR family transcriptional regulator [Aestuariicoccus sp. MJ-SS9]MDU8911910.1 GntR family transcriptional regulator [Aestuariicoccus sp. MJ-SS9]
MADALQIKRPDSLSKIAEDHIRQGIIRGTFQLGESLQEAKLSSTFGMSKTPIREALAALNLQGLVQIIPQRGAFVFSLSEKDVVQLCRFRLILETSAIDLALEGNPAALLDELGDIVTKMSKAREADAVEKYLELDADFHDAFFRYCDNNYLRQGYQKVSDIVQTMRTHLSQRPDRTAKSFEEHEAIAKLLSEGKVKSAQTVLKRQITRGERAYSDLVGVGQD